MVIYKQVPGRYATQVMIRHCFLSKFHGLPHHDYHAGLRRRVRQKADDGTRYVDVTGVHHGGVGGAGVPEIPPP